MPSMPKTSFLRDPYVSSRPPAPSGIGTDVHVENLPPMRYHEEEWFLVQDEGWNYISVPNYNKDKTDEQIVNKMYIDFHKLPGDITLKVIARAFGFDIENKEIAEQLYKAACGVRILQ